MLHQSSTSWTLQQKSFRVSNPTAQLPFQSVADQLPLLIQVLNKFRTRIEIVAVSPQDAKVLLTVLENVLNDVKSLHELLDAVLPPTQASWMKRATKALLSLSREKETASVLERLHSNIRLLVFAQTLEQNDLNDKLVTLLSDLSLSGTALLNPQPLVSYNEGLILGSASQIQDDYFIGRSTELDLLEHWLDQDLTSPCAESGQHHWYGRFGQDTAQSGICQKILIYIFSRLLASRKRRV